MTSPETLKPDELAGHLLTVAAAQDGSSLGAKEALRLAASGILALEARATTAEAALVKARTALTGHGTSLFLDGRNEHGSHVIPMFPNSMPDDAFGEDDGIPSMAEEIIAAAESLGYCIGQYVWAEFHWNAEQRDEHYRVEFEGYWEFVKVNKEMTDFLFGTENENARVALSGEEENGR